MSQFERIAYMDRILRERDSLKSAEAARRFEVTDRQIKRDIEYLRDRLSAPVVYDRRAKAYRYDRPFEQLLFADEKLLIFSVLMKRLAANEHYVPVASDLIVEEIERHVSRDYRSVADRISYELPVAEAVDLESVMLVCQAMLLRLRLDLTYRNAKGERSERAVEPERLVNYGGRWYLVGHDLLRGELRTFHLSRIEAISLSKERAAPADDPARREAVAAYLASGFGIFKGKTTKRAVIRVRGQAAALIARQTWHPAQKMKRGTEDDGTPYTDVDLPAADWRELLGRALSFGAQAEVLAPPDFRALWKDEIRKMAETAGKKP